LLTVNWLTGPKSETGYVLYGPVNRNSPHPPTDLVCPLWTGLTSTAWCCYCTSPSSLAPDDQLTDCVSITGTQAHWWL